MRFSSLRYLIKEGFRNLWANRMMTFASVGVLSCCLLLMGSAVLFSANVNSLLGWAEGQNVVRVFLKDDVTLERAQELETTFNDLANISQVRLIDKNQGLNDLKESLGDDADLLTALEDDNPLCHSFEIKIDDLTKYDATITRLKEFEEVDVVRDQREIAQKLTDIRQVVFMAGAWILAILFLVSLFIIINTIKLTMFVRRLEIGIMKSVGATDGFIRLPFVVEGIFIGFFSSVLTQLIVWLAYRGVGGAIQSALGVNPVAFSSLDGRLFLGFLGVSIVIGVLSGLISIRRYLKKQGGGIFDD